jgi:hypothetical protein
MEAEFRGGIWYLPGEITRCLKGDPDEELGPRQLDKLREGKSAKSPASKTDKPLTSRLPPSLWTKVNRDATQVSQVSEVPTKGARDYAASVKEDSTTVCGHRRIVPGTFPPTFTGPSHGSTGPASTHL